MTSLATEVLSRYGRAAIVFIVIAFAVVWLVAHYTAASGGTVSVAWGAVEYTKRSGIEESPAISSGPPVSATHLPVATRISPLASIASERDDSARTQSLSDDTPEAPNPSFHEYFETLERLRDRNFEREQYVAKLVGSRVSWVGYLSRVSRSDDTVYVTIGEDQDSVAGALASFPATFETELFALRNGDLVEIAAIYEGGPTLLPNLRGISINTYSLETAE